MSWFYNLKTGVKLAIGFGVCIVLAAMVGVWSVRALKQAEGGFQDISQDVLPNMVTSADISEAIQIFRAYEYRHLLLRDASEKQKIEQTLEEQQGKVEALLQQYGKNIRDEEERKLFEELDGYWKGYLPYHERIIALSRAGNYDAALALVSGETARYLLDKLYPGAANLREWNKEHGEKMAADLRLTSRRASFAVTFMLIAAAILSALLGWFVARYIKSVLSQMVERLESMRTGDFTNMEHALGAMSKGDLTASVESTAQPIRLDTRDEFGALAKTFNRMLEQLQSMMASYRQAQTSLREAIAQIAQNAHMVSSTSQQLAASTEQSGQASHEIARGSEQLAQQATEAAQAMDNLDRAIRTVQQDSEAQREAAQQAEEGMKQAAKAVEEVARSAQQMAASAQQASAIAQQGGQSVEEMLQTMRQIQQQAEASAEKVAQLDQLGQQIGNIVQTIEQIAEQTNLLALNAAIEAARAGEHGRGFAVVADEVRKLAEQASSATKEIAGLISNVRSGVEVAVREMQATAQSVTDGFARSEQVGSALTQIIESAQQVAGEVQSVTAVAEEMSASVQQVLATVSTVLQSAEENARAALEMASGAEQVSSAIASVASISEEAAASAEELNASSEEVAAAAQELASMAQQLQSLVSRFRYEETESRPQLRLAA